MIRSAKDKRKAIEGLSSIITAANAAALAVNEAAETLTHASLVKKQAKRAFQHAQGIYADALVGLEVAFAKEHALVEQEDAEIARRQTEDDHAFAERARRAWQTPPPKVAVMPQTPESPPWPEPKPKTAADLLKPVPSFQELGKEDFLHFLKRLMDDAFFYTGIDIERIVLGDDGMIVITASRKTTASRNRERFEHTVVCDVEDITTPIMREACARIEQQLLVERTAPTSQPVRVAVTPIKVIALGSAVDRLTPIPEKAEPGAGNAFAAALLASLTEAFAATDITISRINPHGLVLIEWSYLGIECATSFALALEQITWPALRNVTRRIEETARELRANALESHIKPMAGPGSKEESAS